MMKETDNICRFEILLFSIVIGKESDHAAAGLLKRTGQDGLNPLKSGLSCNGNRGK